MTRSRARSAVLAMTAVAALAGPANVRARPANAPPPRAEAGRDARNAVDAAFARFWAAENPSRASRLAADIVATHVRFDEALRRLEAGRSYTPQSTGVVKLTNTTSDGVQHHYAVNVPAEYDPAKRYQVRFHLHGGVMGRDTNEPRGSGEIGPLAGAEQIYVLPYAWRDAPWWSDDQILNLAAIVDTLKRLYNVDENRVVVSGVSDGATGAYYIAMRETTPFAGFLPLNGFLMVLGSRDIDDGRLFPNNLLNKPVFAVNGERDPLYPTSVVDPYIAHLKNMGVPVDYHPQPGAGHNTAWWPVVKDTYEGFVKQHVRDPHPDRLTWETSGPPHNRAHWIVIDKLADVPAGLGMQDLPDVNVVRGPEVIEFGLRVVGPLVQRVLPGSNAEAIGLKSGDYLLQINGERVSAEANIEELISAFEPGSALTFHVGRGGLPVDLAGRYQPTRQAPPPRQLFARDSRCGRVDLARTGNTIEATTRGVAAFTLLLSPDKFDFTQPIRVVANGRTVFEGRVEPSLATLLKWAARDNDRTMLYGAELHINVER